MRIRSLLFIWIASQLAACSAGFERRRAEGTTVRVGVATNSAERATADVSLVGDLTVELTSSPFPYSVTTSTAYLADQGVTNAAVLASVDFDASDCALSKKISSSVSISDSTNIVFAPADHLNCSHTYSVCLTDAISFTDGTVFDGATFRFTTEDCVLPTLSISSPSSNYALSSSTISYDVTITNAASIALTSSDITVHSTGTASCSVSVLNGTTSTPTVQFSSCSGDGIITFTIAEGVAETSTFNENDETTSAGFIVDTTRPTIALSAPTSTAVNSSTAIDIGVTIGGASSINLTAASVSLTKTGTADCTISVVGGTTSTPTIHLSSCSGDGTVIANVASGVATDVAGNTTAASSPSSTITIDNTGPTVSLSSPSSTLINSTSTVNFSVTYSGGSSYNLTSGGVTVTTLTGNPSCTVTVTNGTTSTPTFTLTACSGDGTMNVRIAAATATDSVGNSSTASSASTTITVDNTVPTTGLSSPSTVLVRSTSTINFSVTYSGATSYNLTSAKVNQNVLTGNPSCTVTVTNGATATPTFTLTSCTGDGTFNVSIAAGAATDAVGNNSSASSVSATITVDNTGPTTTLSSPSSTLVNSSVTINFSVTYGGGAASYNLTAGGVILTTLSGNPSCTTTVSGGTTSTPTFTLTNCIGDGTFNVHIAASTASDSIGNTASISSDSVTITVDNTAPTAAVSAPSLTLVNSSSTNNFTVTYTGGSAYNLTNGGITQTVLSGNPSCTVSVSNGTTSTPTFTLTSCTGDGTMNVRVAAGTALDLAGNSSSASPVSSTITVDNTGPTTTLTAPSATSVNSSSTNNFSVTYSGGASYNLTNSDITQTVITGNPSCTVSVSSGNTSTPTFTLTSCTGDGTMSVRVNAGTAFDTIGNSSSASNVSSTITVDNTGPTTSLSAPSTTLARSATTINFSVTYSGASSYNLTNGGITQTVLSGNPSCTVSVTNGTTSTPTFTLTSCTGDGTLNVTVNSGTATDTLGNGSSASSASSTITIDNTGPTAAITSGPSSSLVNSSSTNNFSVTYTGGSSYNLTSAGITQTVITGNPSCTANVTNGTTSTPTFTLTNCTGDGTMNVLVAAATATDAIGNSSSASVVSSLITVDNTAPTLASATVSNTSPTASPTFYLSFGAADAFASYCVLENDTTVGHCSYVTSGTLPTTYGVTNLNGAKVLSFWIRDSAGNVSSRVDANSVTLRLPTSTRVAGVTNREYISPVNMRLNGKVLIAGGYDSGSDLDTADIYDPVAGTLSASADTLGTARSLYTATELPNGKILIAGGGSSTQTATAELYDPDADSFTATGSMTHSRRGAAAVLLRTGNVLICGGYDSIAGTRTSCELYNPITGLFSLTGSLSSARERATASLLNDGRVYVAGGEASGTYYVTTEIYNPATGTFSAGPGMQQYRSRHTAVNLANGNILLSGGYLGIAIGYSEIYNSSNGTTSSTGFLLTSRQGHSAVALQDGRALIFGGLDDSNQPASSVEIYDPAFNSYLTTTSMARTRYNTAAALLGNGKILNCYGTGSDSGGCDLYNPNYYEPTTFNATGSMNVARANHTATILRDGTALIAGGWNETGTTVATAEIFSGSSFSAVGSMTSPRRGHTATLLPNGKILIAGGFNGSASLDSAELYDPSTQTFSATGNMSSVRWLARATLLPNGKVLVSGGTDGAGNGLASSDVYDPDAGTFAAGPSLTEERYVHGAVQLPNGKTLIAGGYGSAAAQSTAYLYDYTDGSIAATTGALSVARGDLFGIFTWLGRTIFGGGNDFSNALDSVESYSMSASTFSTLGSSLGAAREGYSMATTITGKVLYAGGTGLSSADLYLPESNTFTSAGSLAGVRDGSVSVFVPTVGKILITGGQVGGISQTSAYLFR